MITSLIPMGFEVVIEPPALQDIQEAIDYYDSQSTGLGFEFEEELDHFFEVLENTQFFQVRYDETRCLPLKRFPYMIHYSVDEKNKLVIIRAIFNTSRNPKIRKSRE
ncbi:type II toxin-antitoxin system RelE/ParE family toxin [Aquiflexum sp. LQ15W]|uniref:type II toxin-antitoxin system RelE/ParE family toxin n=1 Tax=Cognataquiflexum nitidum TaxID=2922272 RepID=UPI001F13F3CB|nr:type II toxin-antitoxin system RelE/ParE family toxin [Cognataquiflexum nitidum]MCH6198638.1 type II toxin-antitoxin system RelE/ParE family toxin [Cognataquiflexum nitidum]